MKIGSFLPSKSKIWAAHFADLARDYPDHRFYASEAETRLHLFELESLLASWVQRSDIEAATSLKAFFGPLAGVNHLPLDLLRERGVRVFNIHANGEGVAEKALAMILAFHGRLIEYHLDLRQAKWHGFWVGKGSEDDWDTIFGLRCAILGTGAIGSALAQLLKAFRCETVGWRRNQAAVLPKGFDRVEARLEDAIAGASIVISTLPLTKETQGLVSKEVLATMRGAFLVNVGRAAVIDEEGLYLALRDGTLRGAGLDVWYEYPKPGSSITAPSRFPIHELPNVVLSPHIAGNARQSSRAAVDATVANLRSWLETGSGLSEVDTAEAY